MIHTPGPWTVGDTGDAMNPCFAIYCDGDHIADWIRSKADARLIAAAPDLLAACEAARRQMTNERYNKPRIGMEAECAMCDAAIAKARGT